MHSAGASSYDIWDPLVIIVEYLISLIMALGFKVVTEKKIVLSPLNQMADI